MKAITIYQPWASLIAVGAKRYETRSWATKYRGPIAIHAAARHPHWYKRDTYGNNALESALAHLWGAWGWTSYDDLPRGAVIATAELVECWRIVQHPGTDIEEAKRIPIGAELDVPKRHPRFHDVIVPSEQELLFGDWTPGRYAWELANVQLLPEPVPAKGKQGLWEWELPYTE